jgi:hypothetical protein
LRRLEASQQIKQPQPAHHLARSAYIGARVGGGFAEQTPAVACDGMDRSGERVLSSGLRASRR